LGRRGVLDPGRDGLNHGRLSAQRLLLGAAQRRPDWAALAGSHRSLGPGDPLYGIRRIARTPTRLLSQRQSHRLTSVLDADEHIAVKVAYVIYQKIIAAYADPNRRSGKRAMSRLIESIRRSVPTGLEEIAQLGRTLWRRRHDILAFFDHHASNGPTKAINGRLEALRRNALGFRNITHYRLPLPGRLWWWGCWGPAPTASAPAGAAPTRRWPLWRACRRWTPSRTPRTRRPTSSSPTTTCQPWTSELEFQQVVNQSYRLRSIEMSLTRNVSDPQEAGAFASLSAQVANLTPGKTVTVTGALKETAAGFQLEVRLFTT
jgi:hypothetical protein